MRRGELVRFDTHYYQPHFRINQSKLLAKYPDAKRLDEYAEVFCGPFGTEITSKDYQPNGVPLLRISNITKEGLIDDTDILFLSESKAESLSSTQVKQGDLVVSQRGTLGMPAVVSAKYEKWNISANLIAIRNLQELSPSFVQLYLSSAPGRLQLERCQSGQVQGKITTEDVASVLISSVPNQCALVAEMKAARAARQSKLAEAEELLKGMDGFVLEQLGLKLPEEEKRSAFAVKREELGQRLDTHFYKPHLRKTEEVVLSFKPEVKPLSWLLETPPMNGIDAREYLDSGKKYLRVQNIRPFEIVLDDVKYIETESTKDIILKTGDVLLTRKGTFGVATAVTDEYTNCLISSEVILLRLRKDAECSPDYLATWLNSKAAQVLLDRYKAGGIMGHITQDVVNMFPIPLPPLPVQKAIAAELSRRRVAARRLREEAEQGWREAKEAFEKKLMEG